MNFFLKPALAAFVNQKMNRNMKVLAASITIVCFLSLACNSAQKSVDPTGQGPIPMGSSRSIDNDTIRKPGSDTSGKVSPDTLKLRNTK